MKCPICGCEEIYRNPSFGVYTVPGTSILPDCVEFGCGTRKLDNIDKKYLTDRGKELYERGYISRSEYCIAERNKLELELIQELVNSIKDLDYNDIKKIKGLIGDTNEN